jgi:hypothetical protein
MRSRFSMILALATLLAASLACNAPVAASNNPIERMLEIRSLTVNPKESDGKSALTLSLSYTNGTLPTHIACSIVNPSGAETKIGEYKVDGAKEESTQTINLPLTASQPGNYMAHCWDTSGPASESDSFTITAPAESKPAEPGTNEQPPAPNTGSNPGCHWVVAGTWNVTQVNNYHPVFVIQQDGNTLSGTATLTAAEASMGGYSGTLGQGQGSISGDQFSFSVTWPPKKSNVKSDPGVYSGTITQGKISEPKGVWFATGPSQCVGP